MVIKAVKFHNSPWVLGSAHERKLSIGLVHLQHCWAKNKAYKIF